MNRNTWFRRREICATRLLVISVTLAAVVSSGSIASAEVILLKTNDWELYTSGRVNGFLSYGWGDGYPQPINGPNETIRPGGGLDVGSDSIPTLGPDGMPIPGAQGTFRSMRVRSGFLPNVFAVGLRSQVSEDTRLLVHLSLWTTIEELQLRKTTPVYPDAREGYLQLDGSWGSLLVGRALDLFSRGATENDFLYGHGFSLGFPGNINNTGPTRGLIGFGVLAAFFAPGIVYATPQVGGLRLSVGVYDPVTIAGAWEATRDFRPESELTFDHVSGSLKLHLFVNGGAQRLYRPADTRTATMAGVGYGGRIELGRFHLGVAGHYGRGLGLSYALEDTNTTFDQNFNLRTFDGYSALAQVLVGRFDVNVGAGISRVFLLDSERADTTSSLVKNQVGLSAALVFHCNEHLHFSLDFFRGQFAWYLGEKQNVNFASAGITATW
jgi:hypothetical protein